MLSEEEGSENAVTLRVCGGTVEDIWNHDPKEKLLVKEGGKYLQNKVLNSLVVTLPQDLALNFIKIT